MPEKKAKKKVLIKVKKKSQEKIPEQKS